MLPHGDLVWFWYLARSGCWALLGQTADEKAEYTKEAHRVGSGGMTGIFSVVERVRGGNADVVWPRAREAGISIFRRAAKFGYRRRIGDEGNTSIFLNRTCLQNSVRVDRFDSLVAYEIVDDERHNLPNTGGFHDSYKPGVMHLNASYAVTDYHRFPRGIRSLSFVKYFEKSFQLGHFFAHLLH